MATLALLQEMATQNAARAPGHMNTNQVMGKGRGLVDQLPSYPASGMRRARVGNPGPHSFSEPPLCPPYTKPPCLIRDPLETLPSSSDSSLDSDSDSGPPSLDSITDFEFPESGYEASNLTSISH